MATLTKGIHHVGLTVSKLEESANFFVELLGWSEVKRNPDYPAIFVSDGKIMLTLWASQVETPTSFDRKTNVGLHHLALMVESEAQLHAVHEQLKKANVHIEFGPELVREGPAKHLMCYEPSGIRIEFFWAGM
ncbi:VOC family protein [Vibrio mimicus]|uniref:VOC family protein n=1 Tax=Vibrio mimicus TaxID=674 RepID=UPI0003B1A542|nr:VOC family protein [Vibrio mimicus]ERM53392.1 glyoxalase [Vibrio mimicus CAIM 1882]ERM53554.1 glyoxalase [Vibrio mimicus CAIM 1883]TXY45742.1 VOC family protein [Vibrio mimicus]